MQLWPHMAAAKNLDAAPSRGLIAAGMRTTSAEFSVRLRNWFDAEVLRDSYLDSRPAPEDKGDSR